jgi:hypothetical protein
MKEHRTTNSAVKSHLNSCDDCINDFDNRFGIIDTAPYESILAIKEALCIKESDPSLNKQLLYKGSSVLLSVFD